MESIARIQIGARSDRYDEHVVGRVLYIGNLYIYIQLYGIFFLVLVDDDVLLWKMEFFRQNGHGFSRGEK